MSSGYDESFDVQKRALYILGAGFSAAAGLPLADELWKEVYRRALPLGCWSNKTAPHEVPLQPRMCIDRKYMTAFHKQ